MKPIKVNLLNLEDLADCEVPLKAVYESMMFAFSREYTETLSQPNIYDGASLYGERVNYMLIVERIVETEEYYDVYFKFKRKF